MNIGINLLLWTTRVTDEYLPVLKMLRKIGYEGVEIPIMTGEVEEYRRLGKHLDGLGLGRTASMCFVDPQTNPVSDDPAERQKALDYTKWVIECAQASGVTTVIGPMYSPLGVFTGAGPTAQEKDRAVDMLAEVAVLADGAGITLAIEPINRFETYMANTVAQGAELARRVNSPAVGVMVDTFHANIEENDTCDAIRANGDAIVHVHLSECHRGTPGEGQVDFKSVLQALRHIDYHGWLVIESFGRAMPDLAAATRIWRDVSPSPEHVAREGFKNISKWID